MGWLEGELRMADEEKKNEDYLEGHGICCRAVHIQSLFYIRYIARISQHIH